MSTPWPGPRMVTLVDGSMAWSDSAEWRNECLARQLLRDYSPVMRAQMLAQVEAANGPTVVEKIRATILAIEEQGVGE